MKKLLGLVLLSITLYGYELGLDIGHLEENTYSINVEKAFSGRYSAQLTYSRESDRLIQSNASTKASRACGSDMETYTPEPLSAAPKEEVKVIPPSQKTKVKYINYSEINVDRYEAKLFYTITGYKNTFLDVFGGLGYTDSDIYDDRFYMPIGIRLGTVATDMFNIYGGYKVLTDMDLNRNEDMFFVGVGYKF